MNQPLVMRVFVLPLFQPISFMTAMKILNFVINVVCIFALDAVAMPRMLHLICCEYSMHDVDVCVCVNETL